MFGSLKFNTKQMGQQFQRYGYSQGFRIFTGLVEILGAVAMILSIWITQLAVLAGMLLAVTMIGALYTHIRIKDPGTSVVMPLILLVLSLIVVTMNWNALF